ncbi:hypothetical protein E0T84_00940 [Mycobacterium sp. DBP42]|nr:hypothetical protein [Mycobacterium sp. CnD-18-1]TMS55766.1 hypothetical protein E0T84_00940 [Mycobacterium sp. DBP42]
MASEAGLKSLIELAVTWWDAASAAAALSPDHFPAISLRTVSLKSSESFFKLSPLVFQFAARLLICSGLSEFFSPCIMTNSLSSQFSF